jgi:hypothetical protein
MYNTRIAHFAAQQRRGLGAEWQTRVHAHQSEDGSQAGRNHFQISFDRQGGPTGKGLLASTAASA